MPMRETEEENNTQIVRDNVEESIFVVLERSPTVISYCLDCLTVIFSIAASLFELSAGGQHGARQESL